MEDALHVLDRVTAQRDRKLKAAAELVAEEERKKKDQDKPPAQPVQPKASSASAKQ
jgi:hypothetical protein